MSAPGRGVNDARLVVVTANYPFVHGGGETMFVAPEMTRLAREFGALTVAPLHAAGARLAVPEGVEIDTSLSAAMRRGRVRAHLAALASPALWPELWRGWRRGGALGAARVLRWAATARTTARWAQAAHPPGAPRLFYTYWRGGSTLAFAALTEARPMTAAVTRVHRYELYEDAFDPPFQPWHPALYHRIALTVPVSQHGLDYLRAAGVAPARLELHRLGTEPLAAAAGGSRDGIARIVSCSNVIAVKRVPLIAAAVARLADRQPACRFEWTHFGAGPELAQVRAALGAPRPNLALRLAGQVPNEAVRRHYAESPVDAFVLASTSEGLPVSIQEAASAGVPVIATDVGGVAELVGDDNGVLLPADADAEAIARALERVLLEPDASACEARRAASARRWAEGFDAERNHGRFAARLHALLRSLNPSNEPPTA